MARNRGASALEKGPPCKPERDTRHGSEAHGTCMPTPVLPAIVPAKIGGETPADQRHKLYYDGGRAVGAKPQSPLPGWAGATPLRKAAPCTLRGPRAGQPPGAYLVLGSARSVPPASGKQAGAEVRDKGCGRRGIPSLLAILADIPAFTGNPSADSFVEQTQQLTLVDLAGMHRAPAPPRSRHWRRGLHPCRPVAQTRNRRARRARMHPCASP